LAKGRVTNGNRRLWSPSQCCSSVPCQGQPPRSFRRFRHSLQSSSHSACSSVMPLAGKGLHDPLTLHGTFRPRARVRFKHAAPLRAAPALRAKLQAHARGKLNALAPPCSSFTLRGRETLARAGRAPFGSRGACSVDHLSRDEI
jgi:hypothetical protein